MMESSKPHPGARSSVECRLAEAEVIDKLTEAPLGPKKDCADSWVVTWLLGGYGGCAG
jgi:hypothetical protein